MKKNKILIYFIKRNSFCQLPKLKNCEWQKICGASDVAVEISLRLASALDFFQLWKLS
jgi:hypothetical protein